MKQFKFLTICILLAGLTILASCKSTVKHQITNDSIQGFPIQLIEYDSCEYIYFPSGSGSVTHKGNCKYCVARNLKQKQ